ncbi:hypothetical protein GGR50DRAFT_688863 [Xylaria sp. CBS 124048]|nr:hypothetical protein GGR50DRAFT_688863 [Xylaria sp. CBS 124048]
MNITYPSLLSDFLAAVTLADLAASLSSSWPRSLVALAAGYAALCRALRYRREEGLRRRMGFPAGRGREGLSRMTNAQAQQIIETLTTYEFPAFSQVALEFALFKTYGVESISKLLLATRNLTDPVKSLKRYEDTAALIGEFMLHPPDSERSLRGIARMNFLHKRYLEQGVISNEDLLYTLSVFVVEPARFARLYEWRAMNDMEYCAYGVFWKAIGDAMGIRYRGFLARDAWRDGIEWADDLAAWAKRYEVTAMKPSRVAHEPARALIPMLLYWVPDFAKPFGREAVCVLMGDRVREAFMLPEPGITAATTVYTLLSLRRFFLRHLSLPRIRPFGHYAGVDPATGRMRFRVAYGHYPFYIRPTLWNRWGPKAWAVWLYGGKLPGDDPEEFMPEGYLFTDLGPRNRMGTGAEEMEVDVKKMQASGRASCPF